MKPNPLSEGDIAILFALGLVTAGGLGYALSSSAADDAYTNTTVLGSAGSNDLGAPASMNGSYADDTPSSEDDPLGLKAGLQAGQGMAIALAVAAVAVSAAIVLGPIGWEVAATRRAGRAV